MTSEVGSGQVPIFPTFRGFRRAVDAEVDGSAKSANSRFQTGFRTAGATAGKGFAQSFKAATADITSETFKRATSDIAKASREVSAARLRELDATGKVRVAETALAAARQRYASDSLQVVRAEERLAAAQRATAAAEANTAGASDRLAAAKRNLAVAADQASAAGRRVSGTFAQLPPILGNAGANSGRRFSAGFLDVLGGALGANILTGVGFTIGRGINQGILAGIRFGLDGVQLASELEQSTGAVQSVFKAQAEDIESFAKSAVRSVGLTQAAYQKYATVVGAQLKNLGIRQAAVSGQTDDLITLGADLAAQFGGPTSQAVEALSSLLRGERDPIERYGVSIKQSDINARLAAQGLKGLTGEALRQAEIQATLAILYEQTADAQGTFFRESDSYAHQQQVLNAALEETQTKFGQILLPTFAKAATFANDTLVPALDQIVAAVGPKFSDALDKAGPKVGALLDKAIPLAASFVTMAAEDGIPAVVDALNSMADAAPAWSAAVGFFVDVGEALDDINEAVETFSDSINGENGLVGDLIGGLGDWLGTVDTETDFNSFGVKAGLGVAAGVETGLAVAGPFDFNNFGTGPTPSLEFNSFGVDAGTQVGAGAASGVGDAGAFDFDSFGAPKPTEFKTLGQNYGDALAAGIKSKQIKVGLAGFDVAQAAVAETKRGFGIHSPSTYGLAFGENFTEAVAAGMEKPLASVASSADQIVAAASLGSAVVASGVTVGATSAAATVAASDRVILMDGVPVAWLREAADGARIVFNEQWNVKRTESLAGGPV